MLCYYSSGGSDNDERTLATKQKEQQQDKKKLPADYVASSAPHLRTIIEQQSVEEREAESLRDQPPSPIQDFIDKVQSGRARGVTWPYLAMGYQNGLYNKGERWPVAIRTQSSCFSKLVCLLPRQPRQSG